MTDMTNYDEFVVYMKRLIQSQLSDKEFEQEEHMKKFREDADYFFRWKLERAWFLAQILPELKKLAAMLNKDTPNDIIAKRFCNGWIYWIDERGRRLDLSTSSTRTLQDVIDQQAAAYMVHLLDRCKSVLDPEQEQAFHDAIEQVALQ